MTFAATLHAVAAERVAARDTDVAELAADRRERREIDLAWRDIEDERQTLWGWS